MRVICTCVYAHTYVHTHMSDVHSRLHNLYTDAYMYAHTHKHTHTHTHTHTDVLSGLPHSAEWLQQSNSSIGLMSPMHHSSASTIQSSGNIQSYISAMSGAIHPASTGGSGRSTFEVQPSGLQRSVSLPLNHKRSPPRQTPAMASVHQGGGEGLVSENESMIVLRSTPMIEEPDSSAVELKVPIPSVYHRRRGALRHNRHAISQDESSSQGPHLSPYLGPRTLSASATSSTASAAAVARAAALALHESTRPALDEEEEEDDEEEANPLVESVKHKLLEQGHLSLLDVVEKMPTTLHESIVTDNVSRSCLETITNRVPELQSGHLAHNDSDSSGGAIHWFEGERHCLLFPSLPDHCIPGKYLLLYLEHTTHSLHCLCITMYMYMYTVCSILRSFLFV